MKSAACVTSSGWRGASRGWPRAASRSLYISARQGAACQRCGNGGRHRALGQPPLQPSALFAEERPAGFICTKRAAMRGIRLAKGCVERHQHRVGADQPLDRTSRPQAVEARLLGVGGSHGEYGAGGRCYRHPALHRILPRLNER